MAGPEGDGPQSKVALLGVAVAVAAIAAAIAAYGGPIYPWIKAAHVMAVISWMAGLLYLPRLFVYHSEVPAGSPQSATFKVMEGRLLHIILTPAMGVVWLLGLWLAWQGGYWLAPWFHAKLALVVALSGLQGYLTGAARAFAEDRNTKPARHWRIVNEVPAVLMALIVILVIVKPFGGG
jgi:putative membrane protein